MMLKHLTFRFLLLSLALVWNFICLFLLLYLNNTRDRKGATTLEEDWMSTTWKLFCWSSERKTRDQPFLVLR